MEASDLLKKVRKIEIKTRGLSQNIFAGEYHTAFKGRGMMFSEVREYQYGDDIRDIGGMSRHATTTPTSRCMKRSGNSPSCYSSMSADHASSAPSASQSAR